MRPSANQPIPSSQSRRAASAGSALADLPEIAALKRRRRRLLLILLALAVSVGVGIKPAYRGVKRWRCGALAQESRELLKKGDLEEAFNRARAAHQLLPEDP